MKEGSGRCQVFFVSGGGGDVRGGGVGWEGGRGGWYVSGWMGG